MGMFDTVRIETPTVQLTCSNCGCTLTDFQTKSMDTLLDEYVLRGEPSTLHRRTRAGELKSMSERLHGYVRVYTPCCGELREFDLKFTDGFLVDYGPALELEWDPDEGY